MRLLKTCLVACALAALPLVQAAFDTSDAERNFVKHAWVASKAEFMLGKLAEKRGQSKFVRQFGTMMTKDHKTAYEEAAQLAKSEKIDLPSGLDKKHQDLYNRLSRLRGSAFDREYKAAMFKGHQGVYDSFVKARRDFKNSNVKNYAERYTPIVQMHLEVLQSGKIMGD